ncbi:hypothetical protein BLA60_05780 [Actinophytocola xinjiangensis]|uniref:PE domain-containing protein n=1 Tax=Actinophytocola xinjiangensis TaxID=485602 RepID=A0A7Z0WPY2_9PSEU|nr:PE domain-containing protein [Actinophytocola xinjiangensis]OLF12779.1 hypothetical protein BLA60_05780 [Actinophytocola xinjiangensis]
MDGYRIGQDGLGGVAGVWAELRAGLASDAAAAARLVAVVAPGHEPASGFVASDQNNSGTALQAAITQMQAFVDSYLDGLGQTESQYEAEEASGSRTYQSGSR